MRRLAWVLLVGLWGCGQKAGGDKADAAPPAAPASVDAAAPEDTVALPQQAPGERRQYRGTGQPDIVPHHHPARLDHVCVGAPDTVRDILVQLIRHATAHVVGLEAGDPLHSGPFQSPE